jgi:hypothetical protein
VRDEPDVTRLAACAYERRAVRVRANELGGGERTVLSSDRAVRRLKPILKTTCLEEGLPALPRPKVW